MSDMLVRDASVFPALLSLFVAIGCGDSGSSSPMITDAGSDSGAAECASDVDCEAAAPCLLVSCQSGECVSSAAPDGEACIDVPPAPECIDDGTSRSWSAQGTCQVGVCALTATEQMCPTYCASGVCVGPLRLFVELTGGGETSMQSETHGAAAVIGPTGSQQMTSESFQLRIGLQP